MTEPSPAGSRRLRIVEIAVLADDTEFSEIVERLSTDLEAVPGRAREPLPRLLTWYDGADLPRVVQAEVLEGIAPGPRCRPAPAAPPPSWPVVHPGDFW
jgi:hypothetical protein